MSAPENHPLNPTTSTADTSFEPRSVSGAPSPFGATEPPHVELGFDSIAKRRRVLEWLGAGLRPDQPGRLQQEYPLLFERNASVFHLTLYEGSTPVAFCSLWAVHFRVGVHPLRAGLISLVYTDPGHRGRGYAGMVVNAALSKARALKLGLALLWSDIESLYSRLGFVQAGAESLLLIDESTLQGAIEKLRGANAAEEIQIDSPEPADWKAIERLRGDRDCQLELDPGEISMMRSIPDMSVRVARSAEGIVAFAMRGRGDDFEEVIHEWGGSPEAALRCCSSLLEDCEPYNELFLLTPPDKADVPWQLRKAGARVIQKPLAWMRVLSSSALAEDLSRIVPDSTRIRISDRRAAIDAQNAAPEIVITTTKGELTLDQSTFFSLVLGPKPQFGVDEPPERPSDLQNPTLATILDDAALEILPLPFFVWGMESI